MHVYAAAFVSYAWLNTYVVVSSSASNTNTVLLWFHNSYNHPHSFRYRLLAVPQCFASALLINSQMFLFCFITPRFEIWPMTFVLAFATSRVDGLNADRVGVRIALETQRCFTETVKGLRTPSCRSRQRNRLGKPRKKR